MPPFKGGLGLTPQSASGIAAFYSATSAFVGWLAQRSHEWLRYGHCLEDHSQYIHACKKHTSSTKSAHETILAAVEALCHQAGLSTERRNIQTVKKQNGKTGQGDLVIKRANIGGDTNLIIDVALIHEFGGNHMVDVSRNGKLRHAQPDKLLEAAARTKVHRYRETALRKARVGSAV